MASRNSRVNVDIVSSYDSSGMEGAKTGLAGFKQSIADADGAGGKLKAGWASAKESITANAGALAVAGGAALVAFGVKAVGAFTDTAKAAIDLGAATGLATEDASRWIGVADDFGIGADQLTSSIGKIGKTLDGAQWDEYGIATRDAAGQARNANDILLDSFDVLGKIKNETERTRVGNELFGKGYANLAPLIGKTRGEYEKMLGAVESGQVVTAKEAEKAERMRLAEDALSDALQEVTLAVGGVVAGMAPFLEKVAAAISKLTMLAEKFELVEVSMGAFATDVGSAGDAARALAAAAMASGDAIQYLVDQGYSVKAAEKIMAEFRAEMLETATANNSAAQEMEHAGLEAQDLADGANVATRAVVGLSTAAERAKAITEQLDTKWQALTGSLDNREALLNVAKTFDDVLASGQAAMKGIEEGSVDAETAMRDQELAVIGLQKQVIEYAQAVGGISPEQVTQISAYIDQGSLDVAEQMLTILARNRTMQLSIQAKGGELKFSTGGGWYIGAEGGTVPGPRGAPVPTILHGGETVLPTHTTPLPNPPNMNGGGGGGGNTYVTNVNSGLDPRQVTNILRSNARRGVQSTRPWIAAG
jgi:hypothetical protein